MNESAILWLIFNLLSILVLAFFSMLEMACVSFNKVRLQYYVTKGYRRALWLNYLLQHPSRLFGTTLIGVNIALVVGSEFARQFYSSIGLSPDLAPLTQVIIVVIFGELAPMFAARHYPEHVAMLGVPIIYGTAKLMQPILWVIGVLSKLCYVLIGGNDKEANIYLTQEELQKLLEEHGEESPADKDNAEFSAIATNIFSLRGKTLRQIMEPLSKTMALPSNATIEQMEALLRRTGATFVPLYNQDVSNVVAIAYPRDAVKATETKRVREYARPPWFVAEMTSMMQILKQFRSNNESVAVILNKQGKSIGTVELDDVLEEIFGKGSYSEHVPTRRMRRLMLIDKTLPGDMKIKEFNEQFGVIHDQDPEKTLSEMITEQLDQRPEKGESIYIEPFEFTVKETSLNEIKSISVSTK